MIFRQLWKGRGKLMKLNGFLNKSKDIVIQVSLIFVITFVLGEIVLRAYHYLNPTTIFYDDSYNRYRGKPFSDDWNFKLNSRGFKDKEFSEKKDSTYRIVAIGDSFSFGIVPYEYNYLTLLESKLKENSIDAEVLNMGILGIGPQDYESLFLREGLALKPDMLLLSFFTGNDFTDKQDRELLSYSYVGSLLNYIKVLFGSKYTGQTIHGKADYCDVCYSFSESAYLEVENRRAFVYRKESKIFKPLLKKAMFHLSQINSICKDNGVKLVVVIIPDELQINTQLQTAVITKYLSSSYIENEWSATEPNEKLSAEFDALEIDYIDLYEYFSERPTEQLYRTRDSHWNIAGNELASDVIKDYLLDHRVDYEKKLH